MFKLNALPLKILAVDDDLSLLKLYEAIMARWNMPLVLSCVSSGAKAMHHVTQDCPDILLLDLHLDDINGVNLLRQLRSKGCCHATKIVLVSGMSAADLNRRYELPADAIFMPKPIDFAALKALVADMESPSAQSA